MNENRNKIANVPNLRFREFEGEWVEKILDKITTSIVAGKTKPLRDGKMISYKYFSEIPLPYPTIAEQTHIAHFLSAIYDKLETEKQVLKKYTEQKKYLLANMFI